MPDDLSRLHSYDNLTTRIWQDKRLTPGTRELLLAISWVLTRDPDYAALPSPERGSYLWRQLAVMLGRDERMRRPTPRYKQLVADDAPRYVPPNDWGDRFCEAPRIRPFRPRTTGNGIVSSACLIARHPHSGQCRYTVVRGAVSVAVKPAVEPSATCDAPAKTDLHLVERDPRNGWHIYHDFCGRHRDHYERVKTQLANAPEAPEPVPNVGGLLPCFFKADWARVYADMRPGWTEPVYGLAADDWPDMVGDGAVPRHSRLRLIVGEMADA